MKTTLVATRALLLIALTLVLASLITQWMKYFTDHGRLMGLTRLLNLDAEVNIPTFYSVILLLICSALLGLITYLKHTQKALYATHWYILSLGFLLMAADEFMSFHELFNGISPQLHLENSLWFNFSWVIPGVLLISIIGISYIRFLRHLERTHCIRFLLAGGVYCIAIIGVEILGGRYVALHGRDNFGYSLLGTLEEGLEMLGLILFINALLHYIAEQYPNIRIRP
ncbi:hypothetical protein [Methylovorus sp. MP688]|uniref:hypothetical protein n=1 Tax=Methylovorus sp. (strain MP688) TaxID=887061 RepID=UPI0001EC431E|nr:hypothetical protein [Methylovorus sp. MP688]ADQ83288.1 multidrug resistance protein (efflux pump/antiporter) [Methylovorus sp. MP688]